MAESLAPWDGVGIMWLPANTPESRANALKTVYVGKSKPKRKTKKK